VTAPLRANSPAIDAGDPTICPATDQRGESRSDLRCDIGAFERQFTDAGGDTVVKAGFRRRRVLQLRPHGDQHDARGG
jgi:hypothetical protein